MRKQLWEAVDFVRGMRRKLRFGKFSRLPLQLVRLELKGEKVECEWMARSWELRDGSRPHGRESNPSLQALSDALSVRDLLFSEMPGVRTATLRAYRQLDGRPPELIIAGTATRESRASSGIRSVAKRVKLCGLQFRLDGGKLKPLPEESSKYVVLEPRKC